MNSKRRQQFIITSKLMPDGKFFNPYCVCDKKLCNGVIPAEIGKIIFHLVQTVNCWSIYLVIFILPQQ